MPSARNTNTKIEAPLPAAAMYGKDDVVRDQPTASGSSLMAKRRSSRPTNTGSVIAMPAKLMLQEGGAQVQYLTVTR